MFVALAFAEPLAIGIEALRLGRGLGVDVGFVLTVPILVLGLAALGMLITGLTTSSADDGAERSSLAWGAVPGVVLVIVSRTWISSDSHVWDAPAFVELANWLEIAVIAVVVGFAVAHRGFMRSSVALAVGMCSLLERIDFYFLMPSWDEDYSRPFAALGVAGNVLIIAAAALSLAVATDEPARLATQPLPPRALLPPPRWDDRRR